MTIHKDAIQAAIADYDLSSRKELVTRGDLADQSNAIKLEIEKLRRELKLETEEVRRSTTVEIEKLRGETRHGLAALETRLLKWQIGIGITIIIVMAKGFNWLGF